jgi:hypothetical protein
MQLKFCAFTGADDAVDPKDLAALTKEYPFAEWSILYLPGELGNPRSPTVEWIRKFSEICKDSHTCLHLCTDALPRFTAGDKEVLDLMKNFKRIQFNFEYLDAGRLVDASALAKRSKESPQWEFILQYGKKYKHYLPAFNDVPNHALLFDGSAGEGISPGEWPAPMAGHKCGYAGGINPDNVAKNLEMITRAAPGYATWIDMESGARTDNKFDLAKVRRVLEIAKAYVPQAGLLPGARNAPQR